MKNALLVIVISLVAVSAYGQTKPTKTKFYNFDDLLINGEYRKPQVLYTDARQKVKFDRLLKLKKSFIPELMKSAKEKTFR